MERLASHPSVHVPSSFQPHIERDALPMLGDFMMKVQIVVKCGNNVNSSAIFLRIGARAQALQTEKTIDLLSAAKNKAR